VQFGVVNTLLIILEYKYCTYYFIIEIVTHFIGMTLEKISFITESKSISYDSKEC